MVKKKEKTENKLAKEKVEAKKLNTKKIEKVPKEKKKKEVELPKLSPKEKLDVLKGLQLKPIVTEKVVLMMEINNTLKFEEGMIKTKKEIKRAIEELFNVKVDKVRTLIRGNKKYVYVKLNKDFLAIDIATKLGLM
jgi:large subunit ribosomal protein L23